jgi:hypothetical protein
VFAVPGSQGIDYTLDPAPVPALFDLRDYVFGDPTRQHFLVNNWSSVQERIGAIFYERGADIAKNALVQRYRWDDVARWVMFVFDTSPFQAGETYVADLPDGFRNFPYVAAVGDRWDFGGITRFVNNTTGEPTGRVGPAHYYVFHAYHHEYSMPHGRVVPDVIELRSYFPDGSAFERYYFSGRHSSGPAGLVAWSLPGEGPASYYDRMAHPFARQEPDIPAWLPDVVGARVEDHPNDARGPTPPDDDDYPEEWWEIETGGILANPYFRGEPHSVRDVDGRYQAIMSNGRGGGMDVVNLGEAPAPEISQKPGENGRQRLEINVTQKTVQTIIGDRDFTLPAGRYVLQQRVSTEGITDHGSGYGWGFYLRTGVPYSINSGDFGLFEQSGYGEVVIEVPETVEVGYFGLEVRTFWPNVFGHLYLDYLNIVPVASDYGKAAVILRGEDEEPPDDPPPPPEDPPEENGYLLGALEHLRVAVELLERMIEAEVE